MLGMDESENCENWASSFTVGEMFTCTTEEVEQGSRLERLWN